MPGSIFSRGERVALCTVAEADHDFLERLWNHPEVRPGFGWATPVHESAVSDRLDGFRDADDEEHFLVSVDGEPVGEAFFFDLHERRGRVEVGYSIAPDHRGEGYATEALALLVENAFDERRLHKVLARVLAFNDASRRVLEKVGFGREGRLRDEFFVDGEYVDADLYGLLEYEWRGAD